MSKHGLTAHAHALVCGVERRVPIYECDDVSCRPIVVREEYCGRTPAKAREITRCKVAKELNRCAAEAVQTLVVVTNYCQSARTRCSEFEVELFLQQIS